MAHKDPHSPARLLLADVAELIELIAPSSGGDPTSPPEEDVLEVLLSTRAFLLDLLRT